MQLGKMRTALFLALVVSLAVGAGWRWWQSYIATKRSGRTPNAGGLLGRPLRVGVVSWPGYAGGIAANNGLKPNEGCIFWKKHRLLVDFLLVEDVDARAKAFARGGGDGVDIV